MCPHQVYHRGAAEEAEDDDEGGGEGEICGGASLGISPENAAFNYQWAGSTVQEAPPAIKFEDYSHLVSPATRQELEELIHDKKLPYQPSEFQKVGASILANGHNLFVVYPTGEGKMTLALLAAMLLQRKRQQPQGVTILTQPLTSECFGPCPTGKLN